MTKLDEALVLAVSLHAGQVDKAGEPYILHPLRVVTRLGYGVNEKERIVAALHDVIEDTSCTLEALLPTFGEEIVAALDAISRRTDEPYEDYIGRVALNRIACRVKVADLRDNMDQTRGEPGVSMASLHARYQRALKRLSILY